MFFQFFDELRAGSVPICLIRYVAAATIILTSSWWAAAANEVSSSTATASAEEVAAAKQHNARIVANTPEAGGVFAVRDDGSVVHSQSGMICPASFPNVAFWHAEVFRSNGGNG